MVVAALLVWAYYYFLQKECTPLPDEFFKESPPMEQRVNEKGFVHQTWQNIDGQWHHCATRFENTWHF